MHDIFIFSVPYIEPTAPSAAPALLKGYLATQGFKVTAFDWNLEFKKRLNNVDVYGELIIYWTSNGQSEISESTREIYHQMLECYAKEFAALDTRWLGFGVFSYHSQQCLLDLLTHLRQQDLGTTRIAVGGHGLDIVYTDSITPLIDVHIRGEGELALKELLSENWSYPGINSDPVQIEDLDQLGHADYSDYDLTTGYDLWYDSPMIQITGSRGCVRDCSFCDVAYIWKKYRYRSGTSLAQEIITNHEKTGIRHFYFTDSLINGNIKQLMEMMRMLTDYKQRTGSELTWGGQWIVRSQKGLPADYYKLIKSSGGFNLTQGVETGSDAVRVHMKKNFTNKDLDDEMEQFSRHGICCGFFMLLGYPTETEEDFKDTLRMFKRYVKYVADGTIIGVCVGSGFGPLGNTPIMQAGKDVAFLNNDSSSKKWISTSTNANYLENVRRRLITQTVLNDLKWPASNVEYELRPVLKNSGLLFNESDKQLIDQLLVYKNIEADPEFAAESIPHQFAVNFTMHGSPGEDNPIVDVQINNSFYKNIEIDGTQTLNFTVSDCRRRNIIKITLTNKTDKDILIENGQIVKDKNVKFDNLVIHGSRFHRIFLLMNGRVKTQEGRREKNRDGLYSQKDTYTFYWENPVHSYFIKKHKFYFEERYQFAKEMLQKVTQLFNEFLN